MNMSDGSGVVAYGPQMYVPADYKAWTTRICQLSPCIILFYDYFLTLDREVEYIWKRPVTPSNILYIIIWRWFTRHSHCRGIYERTYFFTGGVFLSFQGWLSFCILWAVQLILQLRVYALYRQSKRILIAMVVGFTAEVMIMIAVLAIGMAKTTNTNEPLPGIRICAVTKAPHALAYVWIPDIVFGTFLFVLAARVGFKQGRLGFNIFRMERKNLVDALVHGNVHYFFCILVVNAVNSGIWLGMGYTMFESPEGFAAVIEIILGCRMVLDLRSAVSRSEGLHLSDSFPLRPSFNVREAPSTFYSAVSTCELNETMASPRDFLGESSGESSRVVIEELR